MRGPRVKFVIDILSFLVQAVEALPEVAADAMPTFAEWVACDRLIWGGFNIVRERKPIVAA